MITNNVDTKLAEEETESSSSGSGHDVTRYIPSVAQGTLIITSRLSILARDLGAQNLSIGEMNLDETLQVLHLASGRPYDEGGEHIHVSLIQCQLI